ncbi:MAG TPA: hypothetical protein VF471_06950 [Pseudoxanthomonas sp.]
MKIPDAAVAQGGAEGDMPTSAYPRLLRIFIGSTIAAALCGLAALATDGDKGLHPAPFLALATLLAIAAACAFLSMLTCLLAEAAALWWKR